ncbi:MAG: diphosphate--fructose-6-phosphate 1-phosphotransferase [Gemmatimonadota bacterium]
MPPLQQARSQYHPKLPAALRQGKLRVELGQPTAPATDADRIRRLFPETYGQPAATIVAGTGALHAGPLTVGVVLSGGQAPGGHNVIAGIFDALKAANPDNRLVGFLKGPGGVIKGRYVELAADRIAAYRNTGGFDMIMSGRDKIETPEELAACKPNVENLGLAGLVIVGGDDSNTNAAMLAEYLKAEGSRTVVIGVPKTIDGDMKNEQIEASFGFDTACKTYAELIGNLGRDALSAVKYWHFVRLMGRSASHIALECALQTHPNVCLIGEEVRAKGWSLQQLADQVCETVARRADAGRSYGIALVPEGLVEFVPEFGRLISELKGMSHAELDRVHGLPSHEDRRQFLLHERLSAESGRVYASLPGDTQEALLRFDSHGNPPVSQIETEKLLIDLVADRIRDLNAAREGTGEPRVKFSPLAHFFGYEGRCAFPSNFDADYCYALGYTAAHLVQAGLTGYTATVRHLTRSADEWVAGGAPVTMMLNLEVRKGEQKPVIRKALVDLNGGPFRTFADARDRWAVEDDYVAPGPIQYFGPPAVCDATTITLALEQGRGAG